MTDREPNDHIKEVYARFGLAMYQAQVLEHGLVNAMFLLRHLPTARAFTGSVEEWASSVDAFMDRHFVTTMGRMIHDLRVVTEVPEDLRGQLEDALRKRNWLAHDFFRERAQHFLAEGGRSR